MHTSWLRALYSAIVLALGLVFGLLIGLRPVPERADPIDSFEPRLGMLRYHVLAILGEPDNRYFLGVPAPPTAPKEDAPFTYLADCLEYGPFRAHSTEEGEVTRYRLTLRFSCGLEPGIDPGALVGWGREDPPRANCWRAKPEI